MAGNAQVKKKKHRIRTTNKTMLLILFVVIILFITLCVLTANMKAKVQTGEQRAADLQARIAEEENRTQEIEDLEDYMKSDDYIEQVAKEKLGMVGDGEIIFKAE